MPLLIDELVFGLEDGRSLVARPGPGLNLIPAEDAEALCQALRETLAEPRRPRTRGVPFVRASARRGELRICVADDASAGLRILEESVGGRIPLFVEAAEDDDERRELILDKLARALELSDAGALGAVLSQAPPADIAAEASPAERAYVAAHARATALAREVRGIDDAMTASVVPGWLFVASGIGGVGVLMTAVTLFHPQLRLVVVPAMIALLVLGLAAYAFRAFRELQVRGALQLRRAELRAAREAAREDARDRGAALRASGGDPDEVLLRLAPAEEHGAPLILHLEDPARAPHVGRQVLAFVEASRLPADTPGRVPLLPQ